MSKNTEILYAKILPKTRQFLDVYKTVYKMNSLGEAIDDIVTNNVQVKILMDELNNGE